MLSYFFSLWLGVIALIIMTIMIVIIMIMTLI